MRWFEDLLYPGNKAKRQLNAALVDYVNTLDSELAQARRRVAPEFTLARELVDGNRRLAGLPPAFAARHDEDPVAWERPSTADPTESTFGEITDKMGGDLIPAGIPGVIAGITDGKKHRARLRHSIAENRKLAVALEAACANVWKRLDWLARAQAEAIDDFGRIVAAYHDLIDDDRSAQFTETVETFRRGRGVQVAPWEFASTVDRRARADAAAQMLTQLTGAPVGPLPGGIARTLKRALERAIAGGGPRPHWEPDAALVTARTLVHDAQLAMAAASRVVGRVAPSTASARVGRAADRLPTRPDRQPAHRGQNSGRRRRRPPGAPRHGRFVRDVPEPDRSRRRRSSTAVRPPDDDGRG